MVSVALCSALRDRVATSIPGAWIDLGLCTCSHARELALAAHADVGGVGKSGKVLRECAAPCRWLD